MAVSHSQTSDDSQSHPPGVYNLKAVNEIDQKRPQCQDTEPIDADVVLGRQLMGETQLVDDSDFDDEKRTCLAEYEDEVVLDSEDEEVNGSRIVNVRSLSLDQRCAAGLSYIDSQEPGEASEDIALNFVDQFVSLNNDLSFHSPRSDKKTPRVKSPAVRSTKGSHYLARMIDLQCQIEKARAYEWVDPEENGALRFLDKKMGLSSVDHDGKKTSSVARHHKVRHIDYSSGNRGNESKFIQHKTESEGKIENGSFNASKEQLNANFTRLQPDSSATGRDVVDIFDVGFNTQMAAEAMEALACADVVNAVTVSGGDKENKTHVEHPSLEKNEFPDVGGLNKKVTQRKRSTRVSKRAGASCQKQELDPDPTAITKVKTSKFFGEYFSRSADPNENLHVESPKTVKKRKLESASDCSKNNASIIHQTKQSMSGGRQKRIEDGCNNPGARMNGVMDDGIVAYRRKKRCLKSQLAEKISGTRFGVNEPVEKKINVKKDDIITYRRKKRTGTKVSCTKAFASLEGDSSRNTCSLKLGLWNHPKRKRTGSNRCRATVLYSPFAPVDGKESTSDYDDMLENSNSMESKSQSSLNSFAPQLSSISDSDRKLSELQYGKVDGTDSLSGKEFSAPSNSTTRINGGSSKAVSHDYHRRPCNKNLPKSSLLKELNGLGVPELMPDLMWKNLRRRRNMTCVRVLISQHLDDHIIKQQKKIIARLGLSVASSSTEATHFVADQFARTRNMLEFIALGKPVVTHMWLESCGEANCLISEKDYILRDAKKEKEIGFSMPVSLDCAKRCPLLKGQKVFITPNIKPSKDMLTNLVKTAQGEPVEKFQMSAAKGKKIVEDILILSCKEDQAICLPFLEKGAYVYSSELVLNGMVIQRMEYKRHQLFTNIIKKDNS